MDEHQADSAASVRKEARARYTLLSPLFWHGMTTGVWLKLLASHRFAMSPTRIPAALSVSAATVCNSTFAAIERMVYARKVEQTRIEQSPIFIIGHWRSGTTFMHELLVRDPRHTFPNTVHCFAPSHFLVSEWMVTHCLGFVMPKKRPMDDMEAGWRRPQEDEFALCNLGVPSPYRFLAFPSGGAVDEEYFTLEDVSEEKRGEWKSAFQTLLKKLTLRERRRIVLKSPTHTGRIKTLVEMFPDAKFIHMSRDPMTLYPSTLRLWQSLTFIEGIHLAKDDAWLEEFVLSTLPKMYDGFASQRSRLAPNQFITVRYEDLAAHPQREVRRVYDTLELGGYDEASPSIDEYLRSTKQYKANRHALPEDKETQIRDRWREYCEMFGYGDSAT